MAVLAFVLLVIVIVFVLLATVLFLVLLRDTTTFVMCKPQYFVKRVRRRCSTAIGFCYDMSNHDGYTNAR